MSIKSNETIVCANCHSLVSSEQETLHRQRCSRGDYSDIGVVDPDEVEDVPTFGEAVRTFTCQSCERQINEKYRKNHEDRCTPDDPLDVGVVVGEGGEQ